MNLNPWARPKGGIGLLLLASLVVYGIAIGLALSVFMPLREKLEWWQAFLSVFTMLSPTALLIARYVEDRKDRRELIEPINRVSDALEYLKLGIDRYESVLRGIRRFPADERRWKIEFMTELLNELQRDRDKVAPEKRIPRPLAAQIDKVADGALEKCREAFRMTRGSTFLSDGNEQIADIDKAIALGRAAAKDVADLQAHLQKQV